MRRIAIVQGHPDPARGHLCHALEQGYLEGATAAGHSARSVDVANLRFDLLRTKEDYEAVAVEPDILMAQDMIAQADHLVLIYPLWLGTMPARLKGFLEQVFRPGFAIEKTDRGRWKRRLKGKSARIVVTMAMPALAYRWYFGAHGLKNLERNILGFCGFRPLRETLFGGMETVSEARGKRMIEVMREHGRQGR